MTSQMPSENAFRIFLATGTVKSFQVKDPTGKLLCEYDDGFYW